jgi:hypothetical protein
MPTPTEAQSDFLGDFAEVLDPKNSSSRINVDPEGVEQGLVRLVLSLVELLRQLLERQAIRRVESGSLTEEEIDRVGTTLMKLEEKIRELQEYFGIDDLNMDLGPLGNLID